MYIYVRLEDDKVSMWYAYRAPFSASVWLFVILSLTIASTCFVLISRYDGHNHPHRFSVEFGFTPLDSICNQCKFSLSLRYNSFSLLSIWRFLVPWSLFCITYGTSSEYLIPALAWPAVGRMVLEGDARCRQSSLILWSTRAL